MITPFCDDGTIALLWKWESQLLLAYIYLINCNEFLHREQWKCRKYMHDLHDVNLWFFKPIFAVNNCVLMWYHFWGSHLTWKPHNSILFLSQHPEPLLVITMIPTTFLLKKGRNWKLSKFESPLSIQICLLNFTLFCCIG